MGQKQHLSLSANYLHSTGGQDLTVGKDGVWVWAAFPVPPLRGKNNKGGTLLARRRVDEH